MKQTAVEWLVEHLNLDETSPNYNKLTIEKAKEMEKEQIMDAAKIMLEGKIILSNSTEIGDGRAEQYYNKIFKQQ